MMCAQLVFNRVAIHLLEQGRAAGGLHWETGHAGFPLLRNAVGCLISREHYHACLEGEDCGPEILDTRGYVHPLVGALSRSGVPDSRPIYAMLQALQAVHDSASLGDGELFDRLTLLEGLTEVALIFGLNLRALFEEEPTSAKTNAQTRQIQVEELVH